MPLYRFWIVPINSFTFSGDADAASAYWQDGQGDSWNEGTPPSFQYDNDARTTVEFLADTHLFSDDPAKRQELTTDTTLNGVTWPRGHTIENEYEIRVSDGVREYQMVAISVNAPGERSDTIVGFTFEGAWPPANAVLTYVPDSARDLQNMPFPKCDGFPCFLRGSLIQTATGPRAIEDLAEGDLIQTRDNGLQPIRWIGSARLDADELGANPNLRPIRISAGALGQGVPAQDLLVSPQHRMLVRSRIAQRMFSTAEVLVAAKQLLSLDGVDIAEEMDEVEYFHMLFDRHEIVIANGAESESLFTGPEALRMLGDAARDEIFSLFPELRDRDYQPAAARLLVSGRQGRKMTMRHLQNEQALVN